MATVESRMPWKADVRSGGRCRETRLGLPGHRARPLPEFVRFSCPAAELVRENGFFRAGNVAKPLPSSKPRLLQ